MKNWETLTILGGAHSMFLALFILPNPLAILLFMVGGAVLALPVVLSQLNSPPMRIE